MDGSNILAGLFAVVSIVAGVVGIWLLLGRIQLIPDSVKINIPGAKAEGPVGFILIAAMLVGFYFNQKNYSGDIKEDLASAKANLVAAQSNLIDTEDERDQKTQEAEAEKTRANIAEGRAGLADEEVVRLRRLVNGRDMVIRALNNTETKLRAQIVTQEADGRRRLLEITGLEDDLQVSSSTISILEQRVLAVLDQRNSALLVSDRLSLSDREQKLLEDIIESFEEFGSDLTYLGVKRVPFPRFDRRDPLAVFEVYSKEFEDDVLNVRGAGLFSFKSERFDIEGDYANLAQTEFAADLINAVCDTAKRAIAGDVVLYDALDKLPELAKYDADDEFIKRIAELQYLSLQIKTLSAETFLLFRGYADGEDGRWTRRLSESAVAMEVHRNARPGEQFDDTELVFEIVPERVEVGNDSGGSVTYGNDELPNLRAYATEKIVGLLLHGCTFDQATSVGDVFSKILDGYVYPHKKEEDRRSRLFVMVLQRDN